MENQQKEAYVQPQVKQEGLLRNITAHCKSGQIDVFTNGCHAHVS